MHCVVIYTCGLFYWSNLTLFIWLIIKGNIQFWKDYVCKYKQESRCSPLLFNLQNNAGGTAEITTQLRGQWRLILFFAYCFSDIVKTQEYRNTHTRRRTTNTDELINAGSSFKNKPTPSQRFLCACRGVYMRVCEEREGGWEDWGWSSSLSRKSICPFNQTAGAKTHDPQHSNGPHRGMERAVRCIASILFGEALCFLVRAMTFVTAKMGWKMTAAVWIKHC